MIDSILNTVQVTQQEQQETTSTSEKTQATTSKYKLFAFDLETTSLKRDSEILQIACVSFEDQSDSFSAYMVPDEGISPAASKVTDLTTSFQDGKKILLKGKHPLETPLSSHDVMQSFVEYLEKQEEKSNGSTLVLVAHNGEGFDFPVLFNSLKKFSLLERVNSIKLCFMDSLPYLLSLKSLHNGEKKRQSFTLSSVYTKIFEGSFDAHDALSDCLALVKILQSDKYADTKLDIKSHQEKLRLPSDIEMSIKSKSDDRKRVLTLHPLPISLSMKTKMAKNAIDMKSLESVYKEQGTKGLLAFLCLPVSGSKPRVTKNRRVLTDIVNFFDGRKMK
jgi:DNA polymerase III epsilon subunit-like protein